MVSLVTACWDGLSRRNLLGLFNSPAPCPTCLSQLRAGSAQQPRELRGFSCLVALGRAPSRGAVTRHSLFFMLLFEQSELLGPALVRGLWEEALGSASNSCAQAVSVRPQGQEHSVVQNTLNIVFFFFFFSGQIPVFIKFQ